MLRRLWEAWKRLARRIGDFQARVILTILYVVLILPFGLGVRCLADPLRLKHRPTKWLEHPNELMNLDWARRQW